MKLHGDLEIGAATHTGCVRRTNEDDYLVLVPQDAERLARRGRLLAIADGMGGVTGGAEASRAAVRAVSQSFLEGDPELDEPRARMRTGFDRACQRVFELSRQSPSLRGMGTTLTVLNLLGDRLVLGHVGDSRCYRLRDGVFEQLTEDHAVSGQENRLTRCIGGGRAEEQADVVDLEVRVGDRFLLATDGLWDAVEEDRIHRALAGMTPQQAADELVGLANERGGPDNSTAVIVRVLQVDGEPGPLREVELPAEEARQDPPLPGSPRRLRAPRWPWLVLLASVVLGALALAKIGGIDVLDSLWQRRR